MNIIRISFLWALLTAVGASTLLANTAVMVYRTEHEAGDGTEALTQPGTALSFPYDAVDHTISLWIKRDRTFDVQTEDTERADAVFLSVNIDNPSADASTSNLLLDTITTDELWHHVVITMEYTGDQDYWVDYPSPSNPNGDEQNAIGFDVAVYVDGATTPVATFHNTLGVPWIGAEKVGTGPLNHPRKSTNASFAVDDVAIFDGISADLLDMLSDTGFFGQDYFDSEFNGIVAYWNFENGQTLPLTNNISWDGSETVLGVPVQSSWDFPYYSENSFTTGTTYADISLNSYLSYYLQSGTVRYPDYNPVAGVKRAHIKINVSSIYGANDVSPVAGEASLEYDTEGTALITFTSPNYIYLDRNLNELGSSDDSNSETFLDEAYFRAVNVGYTVNGQRTDTGGTALRTFTQGQTEDLRIEWLWELEYAFLQNNVGQPGAPTSTLGSPLIALDGETSAGRTISRRWIPLNTTVSASVDGLIGFADADTGGARFAMTGLLVENRPGATQTSMLFDGSNLLISDLDLGLWNGYSSIARAAAVEVPVETLTDLTVEFWARNEDMDDGSGLERLISLGNYRAEKDTNTFSILFNADGDFMVHPTEGSAGQETIHTGYRDRLWHHWAVTYEDATSTFKIYRDAQLVHEWVYSRDFSLLNRSGPNVHIGGRAYEVNFSDRLRTEDPLTGAMARVRVHNVALPSEKILENMSQAELPDATENLLLEVPLEDFSTRAGGYDATLAQLNALAGDGSVTSTQSIEIFIADLDTDSQVQTGFGSIEQLGFEWIAYDSPPNRGTTSDATDGNLIMTDWCSVQWFWSGQFFIEAIVTTTQGDLTGLDELPYILVNGENVYSSAIGGAWVPEWSIVRIGAEYRLSDFPNCQTLSSVSNATGLLSDMTDATIYDAISPNGAPAREFTTSDVLASGDVAFNYDKTVYRAELPLGEFLDVSDLDDLNAVLVPDLCAGGALDLEQGPTGVVDAFSVGDTAQLNDRYVWDSVGVRVVPTAPGITTLEWPDAGGSTTHYIQITSALPTETITGLPHYREDPANEGYRLGTFPGYDKDTEMRAVTSVFAGAPTANYFSLYNAVNPDIPIPVELDGSSADRWNYQKITYATSTDIQTSTNQADTEFRATGPGRAVVLYSYREDPNEVATGDLTREAQIARVVETLAHTDVLQPDDALNSGNRSAFHVSSATANYFAPNFPSYVDNFDTIYYVDFWLKLDESVSDGTLDRVVWEGNSEDEFVTQIGFRGPDHATAPGAFYLKVYPELTPTSPTYEFEYTGIRTADEWNHWVVELDESAGQLSVYLNGGLLAESESGAVDFRYGARRYTHAWGYSPSEASGWLNGYIDNLGFWSQSVKADTAELLSMMRGQRNSSDPVGDDYLFKLDNGGSASSIAADFPSGFGASIRDAGGSQLSNPANRLVGTTYDTFPEVATRVQSRFDTSGFGSAYTINEITNINAQLYSRSATIGNWGPVFPVNWSGLYATDLTELELVWYANYERSIEPPNTTGDIGAALSLHPNVDWPAQAVRMENVDFPTLGKDKDARIYIASRLGSEGVDASGNEQTLVDPGIYDSFTVYNQPNRTLAGYNPNEEHALIEVSKAASLLDDNDYNLGQDAAFALQNDLNIEDRADAATYTSDPWVLVQYQDTLSEEWSMKAYKVEKERTATPQYLFRYEAYAGDILVPPYPVNRVVGNLTMLDDIGGSVPVNSVAKRTLWYDKNYVAWIVSGDGQFVHKFWYPFRDDFWYDLDNDNANDIASGKPIAWVPGNGNFLNDDSTRGDPQSVIYDTYWDDNYAKLKRGETVTFPGGENLVENPLDSGLPAILAMASTEVVFDSNTPTMEFSNASELVNGVRVKDDFENASARIVRPLDQFEVSYALADVPEALTPAYPDNVLAIAERWYFKSLTGSLQKRFFYDSLLEKLVFMGLVNDREIIDSDVTQTPVSLSVLEPNVLIPADYQEMRALSESSTWQNAIDTIYLETQNPAALTPFNAIPDVSTTSPVYYAGFQDVSDDYMALPIYDSVGQIDYTYPDGNLDIIPLKSFGVGSALVPTPELLTQDVDETFYITVAENNHPDATGAVALHIIEIVPDRFRGAVKAIEATDFFDEKINLAHTAEFGGNTENIFYEWWIRDSERLDNVGLPGEDLGWQRYTSGLGLNVIAFSGRPDITLADKLFYVRYGKDDELNDITGETNSVTNDPDTASVSEASWRLVDINDEFDTWERSDSADTANGVGGAVPYQWSGASNSPQVQADGSYNYIPQLVMGWVKRVLDRVNPYEARYSDFFSNESPATYSSQIQIAGAPYIGPVALNSAPNVIENVGLIELYETILARAKDLTLEIPTVATDSTNEAVLLAATRLAFLYELLAREAYSDAQNPLVPVSDDNGLGDSAPFIHAFQNQVADLLEEELALLRGTDFVKAYPSYNRLFWNYVKGTGEAAYNAVYSVQDSNNDGFINEFDGADQYPQGHGDAWGHFLSANNMHYELLDYSEYQWEARSELYSLLDNVLEADYLDEQSFARIAAAKARTGLEIVRATYREAFVGDPEGQWQGYTDSVIPARAWGVSEWSKRSGQAAYFDWVVGNAMVPTDADDVDEGLDGLDRQANVAELSEIAGTLWSIQNELDAANRGANPAGLDMDAITFDIDPIAFVGEGGNRKSHFEQIYERALVAAENALAAHTYASASERQLRKLTDDTFQLQLETIRQDMDLRNRLIEIFGTPHDGQIGTGKPFPIGYEGPDTLLYLYVDRVDPTSLYPSEASVNYLAVSSKLSNASSNYGGLEFDNSFFSDVDDFDDSLRDAFRESYLTASPTEDTLTFDAPVDIATSDYAFAVPDDDGDGESDWGKRGSVGMIQIKINELLLEELTFQKSIEDYTSFVVQLDVMAERLKAVLEAQEIRIDVREQAAYGSAAGALLQVIGILGQSWFDWIIKYAEIDGRTAAEGFPQVVGVSNDTTSVGRASVMAASSAIMRANEYPRAASTATYYAGVFLNQYIDSQLENQEALTDEFMEIRGILADFSAMLQKEESRRMTMGRHAQQMQIKRAELQTLIAEGLRLLDEREAYNVTVASRAQSNRYSDMVTRLARNESLTNFQSAFNHAIRYAWLAAKAYDYETSLDPGNPAAPTTFYESILKKRSLGLWEDGEPRIGNGGLAEILAQLKSNYDVLEGQIGINNPELETGLLSLRAENFRIGFDNTFSNTRWLETLAANRVDDLWAIPEFRKYCRPFSDPDDGAEPGLVIEFSTEISSGKNIFGRELGGGDHAYSVANFATKIQSVGVWFEGYNDAGLATTPRVYLIPVGSDVVRLADADTPEERVWNIVEQIIPTPYVINDSDLSNPNFIPSIDDRNGAFGEIRRFGDLRAYHTSGEDAVDTNQMVSNSRLIGRSVANTQWLLIIPGATLHADPDIGLDRFLEDVSDIKLQFETYSHSGL